MIGASIRPVAVIALAWVLFLQGSEGQAAPKDGPKTEATAPKVIPLALAQARTPPSGSRWVSVYGTYPRVFRAGLDLSAVNRWLRAAVVEDEREFVEEVESDPPTNPVAPGFYRTWGKSPLISASTAVVSALIPRREHLPAGAGASGYGWVSATVQVRTARRIGIEDLFGGSASGLERLAREAQRRLEEHNLCVRDYRNKSGFAPTTPNYENFGLTVHGIVIGFTSYQVAYGICGRVAVRVPFSALRGSWSRLGVELIRGVREPSNLR
jgi:Protein of unknown function (DUF3298)